MGNFVGSPKRLPVGNFHNLGPYSVKKLSNAPRKLLSEIEFSKVSVILRPAFVITTG